MSNFSSFGSSSCLSYLCGPEYSKGRQGKKDVVKRMSTLFKTMKSSPVY